MAELGGPWWFLSLLWLCFAHRLWVLGVHSDPFALKQKLLLDIVSSECEDGCVYSRETW